MECPPIVVPAKYRAETPNLDLMPPGPIDDADALDVITGNYAKYHLLDAQYQSFLDWAEGLGKKKPQ